MTARYCIDPRDPHAEAQVLVTYRDGRPLPTLTSVRDGTGRNLLPDLSEACIRILQLEIAVYYGPGDPFAWTLHAVDVVAAPALAPTGFANVAAGWGPVPDGGLRPGPVPA